MQRKGKIRSWNDQKGFGFIQPEGGGKDVFLHISAFGNRDHRPEDGQLVAYTLTTDDRGRPRADKAILQGKGLNSSRRRSGETGALVVAGLFLALVVFLVVMNWVPAFILWLYLCASLVTFTAYALDKNAAQHGHWRTKEGTLHWLSLIGGWPGALVAQQTLRHKSRKRSFRSAFWVTVVLNVAVLGWLLSGRGSGFLESWAGDSSNFSRGGQKAVIEWTEP